jgi:hypothetical protein
MEMPQLTVMQQALLRYYGNATNSLLCNRHCYVTMEMLQTRCYGILVCHNIEGVCYCYICYESTYVHVMYNVTNAYALTFPSSMALQPIFDPCRLLY